MYRGGMVIPLVVLFLLMYSTVQSTQLLRSAALNQSVLSSTAPGWMYRNFFAELTCTGDIVWQIVAKTDNCLIHPGVSGSAWYVCHDDGSGEVYKYSDAACGALLSVTPIELTCTMDNTNYYNGGAMGSVWTCGGAADSLKFSLKGSYLVSGYYTDPVCATETTGTAFLLDQCYGQYDGTTMISQKYSTSSSQVLSASTYASTVLCAGTSSIDYVTADVCRAITGQYSMVELYKSHGIRGFGVNSKLIAFLIFYVSATILFF